MKKHLWGAAFVSLLACSLALAQRPLPSPIAAGGNGGGGSGANPAGSGSELQYRSNATTFGALTGSSVSGANLTLGGNLTIGTPFAVVTTAIATPSAPTVTQNGTTGATAYSYAVAVLSAAGPSLSAYTAIANGNATLSVTDFVGVTLPTAPGFNCAIFRGVDGSGSLGIGILVQAGGTAPISTSCNGSTFHDTGFSTSGIGLTLPASTNLSVGLLAPNYIVPSPVWSTDQNDLGGFSIGYLSYVDNVNGAGNIAIGAGAHSGGYYNTVIGLGATDHDAGFENTVVGSGANCRDNGCVAIGGNASAGQGGISIGKNAGPTDTSIQNQIVIGVNASSQGEHGLVIGVSGSVEANGVCIGYTCEAAGHAFSVGGYGANGFVSDWYIGHDEDPNPFTSTLHAVGAEGTDLAGGALALAGGQSTGSATGGSVQIKASPAGGAGTSQNALITLATFNPDKSVLFEGLKTTGAATGKKIVCVDTSTGQLYASSSGVACAN